MEKVYKAKTNAAELTKITLETKNTTVIFRESEADPVTVTYKETEREHYIITEKDGTLHIQQEIDKNWFDYIGLRNFLGTLPGNLQIEICVPECYRGDLCLNTSNATVSVSDTGPLGMVDCHSSNGKILLSNVHVTGDITCNTSNAYVTLKNVSAAQRIVIKTANGLIRLLNTAGELGVQVKTSNGKIDLDHLSGDHICLKTSNGMIKGTIVGRKEDFNIQSHTSNGTNNLPGNTVYGEKELNVETSNGKIDIRFLADEF